MPCPTVFWRVGCACCSRAQYVPNVGVYAEDLDVEDSFRIDKYYGNLYLAEKLEDRLDCLAKYQALSSPRPPFENGEIKNTLDDLTEDAKIVTSWRLIPLRAGERRSLNFVTHKGWWISWISQLRIGFTS
jgi:hypothetical protein